MSPGLRQRPRSKLWPGIGKQIMGPETGKKRRRRTKNPRILIAGLGNLLLRDDGVGVHAAKQFQKSAANRYRAVEVGCAVLDVLHLLEWSDKILLIDAMKAGGAPGTVYWVPSIKELDTGAMPASLHELSIIQALRMIDQTRSPEVAIIGVEPEIIDYGLDLSESVEAALPLVIHTGEKMIKKWLGKDVSFESLNT
jgi:hydrogenase maturation protease